MSKINRDEYEAAQEIVWDYEEQLEAEANKGAKSKDKALIKNDVINCTKVLKDFSHLIFEAYHEHRQFESPNDVYTPISGSDICNFTDEAIIEIKEKYCL